MLCIISVELFYLDQKTQECGMPWDHAIKELGNLLKLANVTNVPNHQKIDKE